MTFRRAVLRRRFQRRLWRRHLRPLAPPSAGSRAPALAPPLNFPVATDVRLGGDDKQTRFVIDLSAEDRYRHLHARRSLPGGGRPAAGRLQAAGQAGEHGRGLIKAFRYGLIMQGGSRIVLDTKGPVRVDKAFALAAGDGQPARLVLDLAATDRDSFLHNIALESHSDRRAAPAHAQRGRARTPTTIRAR